MYNYGECFEFAVIGSVGVLLNILNEFNDEFNDKYSSSLKVIA